MFLEAKHSTPAHARSSDPRDLVIYQLRVYSDAVLLCVTLLYLAPLTRGYDTLLCRLHSRTAQE